MGLRPATRLGEDRYRQYVDSTDVLSRPELAREIMGTAYPHRR